MITYYNLFIIFYINCIFFVFLIFILNSKIIESKYKNIAFLYHKTISLIWSLGKKDFILKIIVVFIEFSKPFFIFMFNQTKTKATEPKEDDQNGLEAFIENKKSLINNFNDIINQALDSCNECINNQNELHKQILALNREVGQNNPQSTKAEEKILESINETSYFLANCINLCKE